MTVDPSTRPPTAEEASRFADATQGKSAQVYDIIYWVCENVGLRWSIIDPDSCPCITAVNMLQFAKANQTAFYTRFASRLFEHEISLQEIRERRIRAASQNRFHRN